MERSATPFRWCYVLLKKSTYQHSPLISLHVQRILESNLSNHPQISQWTEPYTADQQHRKPLQQARRSQVRIQYKSQLINPWESSKQSIGGQEWLKITWFKAWSLFASGIITPWFFAPWNILKRSISVISQIGMFRIPVYLSGSIDMEFNISMTDTVIFRCTEFKPH